jgi:hypothetical protein
MCQITPNRYYVVYTQAPVTAITFTFVRNGPVCELFKTLLVMMIDRDLSYVCLSLSYHCDMYISLSMHESLMLIVLLITFCKHNFLISIRKSAASFPRIHSKVDDLTLEVIAKKLHQSLST